MNRYRCKHCGKIVKREGSKRWVKSYCENTQQFVHLTIIKTVVSPKEQKENRNI